MMYANGKLTNHFTTVVVERETLKTLKHMARKDETYDQLIKSLINLRLMKEETVPAVNDSVNVNVKTIGEV